MSDIKHQQLVLPHHAHYLEHAPKDTYRGAQWGEDGSLVDVRIGVGDGSDAAINVHDDPPQHREMRLPPFDGIHMASPEGRSAEQEHAEAESHTPAVRLARQKA